MGFRFHVALPARAQTGRKPEQASRMAAGIAGIRTRPL
jgi:hypothetical protein